jgi:hypothetical protein
MNKSNTSQNSKLNQPLDVGGFEITRLASEDSTQGSEVFHIES